MSATTKRRRLASGLAVAMLLAGGLLAGLAWQNPPAQADVRRATPEQHFQSGAQRSEAVLREMAATLKSIDARLQRLEQLAEKQLAGERDNSVRERRR